MRKIIFTALLLGLTVFMSCQKDNDDQKITPDPEPIANYFPLAIGNYWVYDLYKVENHQETLTNKRDSLIISNDTLIRGNQFFVIEGNWFPSNDVKYYYRDSLGYIINEKGTIIFSSVLFNEVYYTNTQYFDTTNIDTVYHIEYFTNPDLEQIALTIGEFNALTRTQNYTTFPGDESFPDTLKYRSYKSKFIEDIGQATDAVFYAGGPFHFEKRLVKYYIEEKF